MLEQWLALQPYLDEVAKFALDRVDFPIPEWFVAAMPNPSLPRTRDELIEIAAAAIAYARRIDHPQALPGAGG